MFANDKELKDWVDGQLPERWDEHANNTVRLEYLAHCVYTHQAMLTFRTPEEIKYLTGKDVEEVKQIYQGHYETYIEFCKLFAPHKDPDKLYQVFADHFARFRQEFETPDYSIDTGQEVAAKKDYDGPPTPEKYDSGPENYTLHLLHRTPGE